MKKHIFTAALAASLLAAAMSITSMAFYQQPQGKKGILLSQQSQRYFDDIRELGVKQVVFNEASYQKVGTYIYFVEKCKANNITTTMIILNNFGANSDLLPVSSPVDGVGNYAFNVQTSAGEAATRAYARSMAQRYGNYVSNWVIGNEVNDAAVWDYNGISDIDEHAASYAKVFRIFYEEIKKANPDAHVLIPFDMRWRAKDPNAPEKYTVSEYLPKLNALLKDTDYGIAWHAYPVQFFTGPEFENDDAIGGVTNDINTTPNINLKNINVLTDYMQTADMLSPDGKVRHLLLTEQGFTSTPADGLNGEARQAEAIKQAWEVVKNNPYIEGFYLSRHVDAASQVAAGGAFGLWTRDENSSVDETMGRRKTAWYTYRDLTD